MPFLTSLLSCCDSDSPSEKAGAETRHARIVSAVNSHDFSLPTPRSRSRLPPPEYHESPPQYGDIAHNPLITIEEKNAAEVDVFADGDDNEEDTEGEAPPPPISPRSSVISIPSTRLTDLTSLHTGETLPVSLMGRPSLDRYPSRGTRPPSYYNTPRRTPSPAFSVAGELDSTRDEVWLHPVMQSDWLDLLQQHAARRATMVAPMSNPIARSHMGPG